MMLRCFSHTFLPKALALGFVLCTVLGGATARAQVTVEPGSMSVTVEQHETATRTVTLTNTGSAALSFCLSFERPLQRTAGTARISGEALGGACGPYGEVLALVNRAEVPTEVSWDPYGLTMTPDGQFFAADNSRSSFSRTVELTPELEYVRQFSFPREDELDFSPATNGVTYKADTGTLWWLNVEDTVVSNEVVILRALLLEGDLDGVATGRRIELPIGASDVPFNERVSPAGLAYDSVRAWFYYSDNRFNRIWAVDTLGYPVEGYPVPLDGYPGATLGRGLNAVFDPSMGNEDDLEGALRLELYAIVPGPTLPRLRVVGRYGEDTTPGAEPLETPYASYNPSAETGTVNGEAVRSVLDPNGVLYYPWGSFEDAGIVAIRPHPLPPSWLVVEAWDGALAPGESTEIELTFRPGVRAVGAYTAVLQAFEAESGTAVEVPLTLAVTQGTDAEDEAAAPEASSLAVYPNPTAGRSTVAVALAERADVRVAVYDVLGRRVAVLHDGRLGAGRHDLALDGTLLPAGVYAVRVSGEGLHATQRITLLR